VVAGTAAIALALPAFRRYRLQVDDAEERADAGEPTDNQPTNNLSVTPATPREAIDGVADGVAPTNSPD
jgi:hypothetical protein